MPLLLKGIVLGITLSFLIGPIFFAMLQASLEKGSYAGLAVGSGIWMCDSIFIWVIHSNIHKMAGLASMPGLRQNLSIVGGIIFLIFGLWSMYKAKPVDYEAEIARKNKAAESLLDILDGEEPPNVGHNWKTMRLFGYWLRGFVLNMINPFTVFFWIGIATTVVLPNQWTGEQVILFFGGMMAALIGTDFIKVFTAKHLKAFLSSKQLLLVQRVFGGILVGFGLFLLGEAIF